MKKLLLSLIIGFLLIPSAYADTLTVYPSSSTGGSTVDGYASRNTVDQTFAAIIAGAGNAVDNTTANAIAVAVGSSSTTNQFKDVRRYIATFDTSDLTASVEITEAVLSLRGTGKANALGSDAIHICAATPASNTVLVNADYGQLGSTSFANIAYASWSTTAYNDFTLDANGEANISKTGISRFGSRMGWDIGGTFGGAWASNDYTFFQFYTADQTGTTNDPKLSVIYSVSSPSQVIIFE